MIIGHLPVGYFATRFLIKKLGLPLNKIWLGIGIFAAIIPDLDYIYWILSNSQAVTHRGLVTTKPFLYLILLLIFVTVYCFYKKSWLKMGIIIIFSNIFLHFLLDTVFYGIQWLYPLSDSYFGIYNVSGYGSGAGIQVADYFHHWYWYLEIAIWILSVVSVIFSHKKHEFDAR